MKTKFHRLRRVGSDTIEAVPFPEDCRIAEHYLKHWPSKPEAFRLTKGRLETLESGFCVLVFPPSAKRKAWTYAKVHMSTEQHRIEAFLLAPERNDDLHVELLTMTASFHASSAPLGWAHVVNIGRPWLPGSNCDRGLLSTPYLDGPSLEILRAEEGVTQYLWFIPITESEAKFRFSEGLEALEQKFEAKQFNYLDPNRPAVV
jgi:hypothetical protein